LTSLPELAGRGQACAPHAESSSTDTSRHPSHSRQPVARVLGEETFVLLIEPPVAHALNMSWEIFHPLQRMRK